jgi:hypothetical protein
MHLPDKRPLGMSPVDYREKVSLRKNLQVRFIVNKGGNLP